VSSKADASSSYLTEKERNLGAEILELIKKSDYSYLEINKVFYALDRELQYRANNNKL
ncbi:phage protein, partial [Staphylococcus aureus F29447]